MSSLPEGYRDDELFEFIQVLTDLTVRLLVRHTSKDRPQTLLSTQTSYPGHGLAGKECVRAGSGWVQNITILKEVNQEPCPCSSCTNSGNPQKIWGRIEVVSANHVVFNTEEAKHTLVDLFFNKNAEDPDKLISSQVEAYAVWYSNISEDKCWIFCATHNLKLCSKLSKMVGRRDELHPKINDKYEGAKDERLTIIMSHPHGCAKQISMSRWASRELNIDST